MNRTRNYVNNQDLTAAIVDYQKLCRKAKRAGMPQPQMPRYIGEAIIEICNRLTRGANFDFVSYTYRDEMIQDAIERCCYAVLKFNSKKSSGAFNYMSTVAINSMKKKIIDEKKQNYIRHKVFHALFLNENVEGLEPNEYSHKVVDDFERKLKRKP